MFIVQLFLWLNMGNCLHNHQHRSQIFAQQYLLINHQPETLLKRISSTDRYVLSGIVLWLLGKYFLAFDTAGTVNVRLKNNTNAGISYQAIGHTQPQYLAGRQEFVLRNLPTPISITLVRQDGRLLKVMPMSTSEDTLAVSLDETTNFGNNQGVLRI